MNLRGKNILITAGPTWMPIDRVRVISNIATGKTGVLLARQAKKLGAKVTLILGPVGDVSLDKSIKILRFFCFDELHNLIESELASKKYDIVIHSAAVSDYKPKRIFSGKLKSDTKSFNLELESTIKIADKIKKFAQNIFLVIFKLEFNLSKYKMLESARKTMQEAKADLAVANTFSKNFPYKATIIDRNKVFYETESKEDLTKRLLGLISLKLNA